MLFRSTNYSTPSPFLLVLASFSFSWERARNPLIRVVITCPGGTYLVREKSSPHSRLDATLYRNILTSYLVWLAATRTAKLLPHLWTRPQDIVYVPAFILFGYYFAIMKIYALLTLHEVGILVFVVTLGTLLNRVTDWLGYSRWCW